MSRLCFSVLMVALLAGSIAASAAPGGVPLWESLPGASQLARAVEGAPDSAHVSLLNIPEMSRFVFALNDDPVLIDVPLPDGTTEVFSVTPTDVFHPDLSRKYPGFTSFKGQSVSRPGVSGRFDYSEHGFHGQIFTPEEVLYVMPWQEMGDRAHASFSRADLDTVPHAFRCRVRDVVGGLEPLADSAFDHNPVPHALANLKTYRIAIATTAEYSAQHGGTKEAVLARIGTLLNMLNGIYERDVGATFQLVPNNDQLIFLDAGTDPYPGQDEVDDPISGSLDANKPTVHNTIGSANYDVGHLFMHYRAFAGEGAATVSSACSSDNVKADGGSVDIRGGTPEGMVFVADVFAHEVGHQFSATHSYNATTDGCAGQRDAPTAFEIGGGQTIMAYGGSCGSDNVVQNNLPFFNHHSISQIRGQMAACGATQATTNTIPTVNAGPNVTIPMNTPFELAAVAHDSDGDTLSYSWEQHDTGPAQGMSGPDNGSSPLFRIYSPTASPTRRFPSIGNLPGVLPTGEIMPVMARNMNLHVMVRDGNVGGSASDAMVAVVTTNAGPFRVTSQSAAGMAYSNTVEVTWSVANTHLAPVNCTHVDIFLVQGSGPSLGDEIQMLASNTPNDGSHSVLLPAQEQSSVRIKVKGRGNIFFDLNDADFSMPQRPAIVDMEIVSVQGPTHVTPNTNVAMYVTLRNNGPENVAIGEFVFDWPDAWEPTSPDFALFGPVAAGATTTLCFMAVLDWPDLDVTDAFLDIHIFVERDTNLANNTLDYPFVLVLGPDLSISDAQIHPAQVLGGQVFSARVVVSNAGPTTARSTLVTLTVPPELHPQGPLTNLLGDLSAGDVGTATFDLLPSLAANSSLSLTATASSADADPALDNNTTNIVFTPNRAAQTVFNGCFNLLDDGGFEHDAPWPAWPVNSSQAYSNQGAICGCDGEAGAAAATGSNWVWFAQESTSGEVARVAREVLFPDGAGQLHFDLWIGQVSAPFTDVMTVSLDTNILLTFTEPSVAEPGYVTRSVDVSSFCDGATHTLAFDFVSPDGGGLSSFNLDNVRIEVCMDQTDDDNDGVPDAWERRNQLSTNDTFDVFQDDDGDGENNFREWVSGTDPQDSNSVLRVTGHIVTGGGGAPNCINIESVPGRRYQLQSRDGMGVPAWSSVPVTPLMGTGRTLTLKDPATVSNRVYRVVVDIP